MVLFTNAVCMRIRMAAGGPITGTGRTSTAETHLGSTLFAQAVAFIIGDYSYILHEWLYVLLAYARMNNRLEY